MSKTTMHLTGGTSVRVEKPYGEMRKVWEDALAHRQLLEVTRADGGTLLLNPANVDYIVAS